MARLSLAAVREAEDPLRGALAEAIGNRAAALAEADKSRAGLSRAHAMVADGRIALEATAQAAEAARKAHAASTAAAAISGSARPAPSTALKEALASENDLRDQLGTAYDARDELQARLTDAESEFGRSDMKVREAAKHVMAQAVGALVASITQRQADLVRDRLALRWLCMQRLAPDWPGANKLMFDWVLPAMQDGQPAVDNIPAWERMRAHAPWEASLAALVQDADAQLPTLEKGNLP